MIVLIVIDLGFDGFQKANVVEVIGPFTTKRNALAHILGESKALEDACAEGVDYSFNLNSRLYQARKVESIIEYFHEKADDKEIPF